MGQIESTAKKTRELAAAAIQEDAPCQSYGRYPHDTRQSLYSQGKDRAKLHATERVQLCEVVGKGEDLVILGVVVLAIRGEMVLVHDALVNLVVLEKGNLSKVVSDRVRRQEGLWQEGWGEGWGGGRAR